MSLLADYLKERGVKDIVETDAGFATYAFLPEGCYVEDIYVSPKARGKGHAKELLNKITDIAKERGCTKLYGTCVPSALGSHESLCAAFAYGFKLLNARENLIVYSKDI